MIHIVFQREDGRIVGQVPEALLDTVLPHHDTLAVETLPDFDMLRVVDGRLVPIDWPIETLRTWRWNAVRAARDRAQEGGCPTALGRVDTDEASRGKISGSVQLAMIAQAAGQPFQIAWTMQDNATAVHDAPAMIAMGVAVGRHVAACHAEGLARRAAIDAATDAAGVAAVPIEGGWPGA